VDELSRCCRSTRCKAGCRAIRSPAVTACSLHTRGELNVCVEKANLTLISFLGIVQTMIEVNMVSAHRPLANGLSAIRQVRENGPGNQLEGGCCRVNLHRDQVRRTISKADEGLNVTLSTLWRQEHNGTLLSSPDELC
jgi:hypothetical protein